jgi:hypothetical protein
MPSEHDTLDGFRPVVRGINAGKPGTTLGHSQILADKRFEDGQQSRWLDESLTWVHLGLAYVLIRIDRSLIEVFNASAFAGDQMEVRTVRAEGPVAEVVGGDYSANPWGYIVQGLPAAKAKAFIDFVASYKFVRRGEDRTVEYWCNFQEIECNDPTAPDANPPRKVKVWFALPARQHRQMAYMGPDLGARPGPPRFCMVAEKVKS